MNRKEAEQFFEEDEPIETVMEILKRPRDGVTEDPAEPFGVDLAAYIVNDETLVQGNKAPRREHAKA